MAETQSRPRKVGEYERPARSSSVGIVIGTLMLIGLIILAIILFKGPGERTGALSHEGVRYAALERPYPQAGGRAYGGGDVCHKDVDGEQIGASQAPDARGFAMYAADFRRHHTTTFASSALAYEDCEPAYRYDYDLGTNERYYSRDWAALETDVRRDWETHQPGTGERFKDVIRYSWDKVRGRA